MADLYPDYDGIVYKYAAGTWASIRSATSGTLNVNASTWIENLHTAGRGGNVFNIGRYFIEFDTSGITSTLTSATLKIYGYNSGALDVILLKSSQSGTVGTGDFNEITNASTPLGNSDGDGAGTFASTSVVEYSSEISSWSTSSYNEIVLNDNAKADIIANDAFNCVLMGFDWDVRDIAPSGATYRAGFRQDAYSGTSSDPKLIITEQDDSVFFGCNF